MQHECKITVLETKIKKYIADPDFCACPFLSPIVQNKNKKSS